MAENEMMITEIPVAEELPSTEVEEVVQVVEVEEAETVSVEVDEVVVSLGDDGNQFNHALLNNRELPNQHPITAIEGLREELDSIEALQTIYSDKKQQADYYLWHQDENHLLPSNPYGLFVSIYPETDEIQVCDGTMDVFGVTVIDAAFVGNQEYAKAVGGTKTGRDGNYALVVHSGLVGVRCETAVLVGDYVVPNGHGKAKRSVGDYGYLVTSIGEINGIQHAIISLSTPSTLVKSIADNVEDLSERMSTAEYKITSVTNVANSAYVIALEAKEKVETNSANLNEQVGDISDRMDEIDRTVGDLDNTITKAEASATWAQEMAQSAVDSANAMKNEAVDTANEALEDVKATRKELEIEINNRNIALNNAAVELESAKAGLQESIKRVTSDIATLEKDLEPLATWPKDSENPTGIAGFVATADENGAILGGLVRWIEGEDEDSLAGFIQKAGVNEATTQQLAQVGQKVALIETKVDENKASLGMLTSYIVGDYITIEAWDENNCSLDKIYYDNDAKQYLYCDANNEWQRVNSFHLIGNDKIDTEQIYYVESTGYYLYYDDEWKQTEQSYRAGIRNVLAGIQQTADANAAKINSIVSLDDEFGESIAGIVESVTAENAEIQALAQYGYTDRDGQQHYGAAVIMAEVDKNKSDIEAIVGQNGDIAGLKAQVDKNTSAVDIVTQRVTKQYKVVALETGIDSTKTNLVYYVEATKKYHYYDGISWQQTEEASTAGLPTSITGIQSKTDENSANIISLTSWKGETNDAMTELTQKADANGAYIQGFVSNINKYSYGPYSQAHRFTYEEALNILEEGTVYVPDANHSVDTYRMEIYKETDGYDNVECGFLKGYYYTWKIDPNDNSENPKPKWIPSQSTSVIFSREYVLGSNTNPYWVAIEDITHTDGTVYKKDCLYKWHSQTIDDVKYENWIKVASLQGNLSTVTTSILKQTSSSIEAAVTDLNNNYAGTKAWVGDNKSVIQNTVEWHSENGNKITTFMQEASDNFASATQVAQIVDKAGNIKAASIVAVVNDNASDIYLDADNINLTGYVTFDNLENQGETTINGANIITGSITALGTVTTGTIQSPDYDGGTITKWEDEDVAQASLDYQGGAPATFSYRSVAPTALSDEGESIAAFSYEDETPVALSDDDALVATFNITTANTIITLKNLINVTEINWGDGSQSTTSLSHKYTAKGTYTCKIYGVTNIGDSAFWQWSSLTSITIPASVTSIGSSSFYNCYNLTSVTIGNKVTSIGEYAFYSCDSVTEVTIPDSVTDIGNYAFQYCDSLTSVTIGNSVKNIGYEAFADCNSALYTTENSVQYVKANNNSYYILMTATSPSLSTYRINANTKIIGSKAFDYCSKLTEITIPSSVISIGNEAFYSCTSLPSITIPNSVTSICDSAFGGCTSLTSITVDNNNQNYKSVDGNLYSKDGKTLIKYAIGKTATTFTISDSVITIGNYAFSDCSSLTSITIPNSVVTIGDGAFSGCDGLINVVIPNSVTSIGSGAFSYCSSLTNIEIPNSVASIGANAFYDCSSALYTTENNLTYFKANSEPYCVLIGVENENLTTYQINAQTKHICDSVFVNCNSLTNIIVDSNNANYMSIDGNLYSKDGKTLIQYARGKTDATFTIPDSVTSISSCAFYNCSSLTEVTIPNSVTSIGVEAFANTTLNIVHYIGNEEEWNNIIIGNDNECLIYATIYYYADSNGLVFDFINNTECSVIGYIGNSTIISIPSMHSGKTVTSIGEGAFSGCSSLTSITIPSSVKYIDNNAFRDCSSLKNIYYTGTIDEWVQIYFYTSNSNPLYNGADLYINNQLVTTANITTATKISNYAFYGCDSLTSVIIGNGVTSIGTLAFSYCSSLTSITIRNCVEEIGYYAFIGCNSLTKVYYFGTKEEWYEITIEDGNDCLTRNTPDYYPGASGLAFKSINGDTECSVTGYTGSSTIVEIPPIYNGLKVTDIGSYAFKSCTNLLEVIIPDSVITINNNAFNRCEKLNSITIPDSVAIIDYSVFFNCYELENITIPNSVNFIGANVFSSCRSLKSIRIPNKISSISSGIFYNCTSLKSVTIPKSVKSIGNDAFNGCSALTTIYYNGTEEEWDDKISIGYNNDCLTKDKIIWGEVVEGLVIKVIDDTYCVVTKYEGNSTTLDIPSTYNNKPVTSIGNNVFEWNYSLTSVTIPETVTSIGDNAFYNCGNLTSVEIPDSVTSIGDSAFNGCSSLTNIKIPDDVRNIGQYTFSFCYELASITIPEIVENIGEGAFTYCTNLTSITIPNGVKTIGDSAFAYCENLTSVTIGKGVESIGTDAFLECPIKIATIPAIACSYVKNYNLQEVVITSGESIGDYAFNSCDNLTSITIPSSVTSIGDGAFSWCDSLTEVTIPDSVTSLGNSVFYYCTSLTSVNISNNLTSINDYVFAYCNLTNIIIPASVTSIGSYAFRSCSSLSVTIPDSVESIGDYAFDSCDNLIKVNYTGTIDSWAQIEFGNAYANPIYYAKKLYTNNQLVETANIRDISTIKQYAFYNCDSLTKVTIDNLVTNIDMYAFYSCTNLSKLTIGNRVTSIGSFAFLNCNSLTKLTISNSVTIIDKYAFDNCNNLIVVYYLGTESEFDFITIGEENECLKKAKWYYGAITEDSAEDLIFILMNNTEYSVIGYTGNSTTVNIPETYNGKFITNIGDGAFADCDSLTSVTISDRITSIGNEAFYGCDNLTNITIGNNVTNIGYKAFYNCDVLTSITIPSKVTDISDDAFYNCDSLTSIVVDANNPNYMSIVGNLYSKDGQTLLQYAIGKSATTFTIPNSVTTIGSYAFAYCSLTTIVIPDNVKNISSNAFLYCDDLRKVNYTSNIDDWVQIEFADSTANPINYSKNLYINDQLVETDIITAARINDYAFYNCDSLTSITIEESVKSIGDYAFKDCSNLSTVYYKGSESNWNVIEIGDDSLGLATVECLFQEDGSTTGIIYNVSADGPYAEVVRYEGVSIEVLVANTYQGKPVSKICEGAFNNANIQSIIIPDSITSIGNNAFRDCSSLTKVNYTGTIDGWAQIEFGNAYANPIYYAKKLYTNNQLVETANIRDISTIKQYTFYNCDSLTKVTIGNSVTSIGSHAFISCSSLTSIVIPDSVTTVGDYAFSTCSILTEVIIPDSVESIGYHAFEYCSSLTEITIPNSVTSIGNYVFRRCSKLESITIPNKVTSIGDYAFEDCLKLESITIPNSVESISKYAFSGCSGLTNVIIPNSVASIGDSAFYNCSSLTSITLPFVGASLNGTSNTHFGYIFGASSYSDNEDCVPTSLETVTITGGTRIGDNAFYNCSKLKQIRMPDTVTTIGISAFYNCCGLEDITIPNKVANIGSAAFDACSNLTNIKVKNSNTSYKDIDGNLYSKDGTTLVQYAIGKTATMFTIPKSVTKIRSYAFSGCNNLTKIIILDSVTNIYVAAFRGCNCLESITLPFVGESTNANRGYDQVFGYIFGYTESSSLSVSDATHQYTSGSTYYHYYIPMSLRTVIITGGTSIGDNAFYNCNNLTNVTMSNSVTSIGSNAFKYCSGLTNITISNNVESIGDYAFENCSCLTDVVIPLKVQTIGTRGFANCGDATIYCEASSRSSGWSSDCFSNTKGVYYYSSTQQSGDYWHYSSANQGFKISCDDLNMIDSKYFKVTKNGEITATRAKITGEIHANSGIFNGTVNATDGTFTGTVTATDGNIGGFNIGELTIASGDKITLDSNKLTVQDGTNNMVGMCSESGYNPWAIWAGEGKFGDKPFRVGHDGSLHATQANIKGYIEADGGTIGGFKIEDNGFTKSGHLSITSESAFFETANFSLNNDVIIENSTDTNGESCSYIVTTGGRHFEIRNYGGAGIRFNATSQDETIHLTLTLSNFYFTYNFVKTAGSGQNKLAHWNPVLHCTYTITDNSGNPISLLLSHTINGFKYKFKVIGSYAPSFPSFTIPAGVSTGSLSASATYLSGNLITFTHGSSSSERPPSDEATFQGASWDGNSYSNTLTDPTLKSISNNNNVLFSLGSFCPNEDGTYVLGKDGKAWQGIRTSTSAQTDSDRRLKNDIKNLPESYNEFFDKLNPVSFKYLNNTSDRTHVGFIAQDVEASLIEAGIEIKDFAGICIGNDEDKTYSLRYEEFIPLNTLQIQNLKKRVAELEETVELLKTQITQQSDYSTSNQQD